MLAHNCKTRVYRHVSKLWIMLMVLMMKRISLMINKEIGCCLTKASEPQRLTFSGEGKDSSGFGVKELSSSGESLVIGIVNAFGPLSQLTSQLFHQMDKFINLDFSAWGKGGRELCDLKTSYPVCCFVLSTLLEQFLNIFLEFENFLFHPLAFSSQFQLYMFIYDMKCFSLSGDWCCGS